MTHSFPTRRSSDLESDSMGEIAVPADRYWGAQTQRSLQHFRIGGERMPPALVKALGVQKLAAARTNKALGVLDAKLAEAICQAEIGRAHVCTPVTHAHLVCPLLLEKTKHTEPKD